MGAGGARVHGGRVRRHRHQPALYAQCCRRIRQSHGTSPARSGARRRVADLLVADRSYLPQISRSYHARRQPRRGRHPGADRAGLPAARKRNRWRAAWSRSAWSAPPCSTATASITPAISVLSAIEGLNVAAPRLRALSCPAHGRYPHRPVSHPAPRHAGSAAYSGRSCWSGSSIAGVLGVRGIVRRPRVLAALDPLPAVTYFWRRAGLCVLGGAFLAVTGGEAFYADMGHFGPLRSASPGSAWSCPRLP